MRKNTRINPSKLLRHLGSAGLFAFLASGLNAQFSATLFTDNFTTEIASPGDTTDLNTNIGQAGGRQGGALVDSDPAGFGWGVFGQTVFPADNGWDLRSQAGWPASGPVDQYTLRFRHEVANDWSTVTPNIGFASFYVNNSYRFQTQIIHAHEDANTPVKNDRWAALTFGEQPAVRFPAFELNAGILVFASGDFQIFSNNVFLGGGSVTRPANGLYELDLQVIDNLGGLYINTELVASNLDFSAVLAQWVGLTALPGTDPDVFTSTQIRFDNFSVSTVPEPHFAGVLVGTLALGLVGMRRRKHA